MAEKNGAGHWQDRRKYEFKLEKVPFLGLPALFGNRQHTMTARASWDAEIIGISANAFTQLVDREPQIRPSLSKLHEHAAHRHSGAAKHRERGNYEQAASNAHLAQGRHIHAADHAEHAGTEHLTARKESKSEVALRP